MIDYQKVFEFAPTAYLLISPELLILDVNEPYLRATKTKRNEIVGKPVFEVFPGNPKDATSSNRLFKNSLDLVIKTNKPHIMKTTRYDIPLPDKNGKFEERFWSSSNSPVLNNDGKLISIIHNTVDVTALIESQKHTEVTEAKEVENRNTNDALKLDQKKIEQVQFYLDAANYELKLFIQINPVPMVIWRGKQHIYSIVNTAHDKMLRKSVLGKTIREAHSPEEAKGVPDMLDHVYKTGEPFVSKENHYRVLANDGKEHSIWVNEWFYPIRDKAGIVNSILGVAQDVTEQVSVRLILIEKQDQLQQSIFALEQERQTREQFVATLTHDLRVPLSAAKMGTQLISRKPDETDSVIKLAAKVNHSIERIDTMIRDLLDANRIKAGEALALDISEFDLIQMIKDTINELGTEFGDRFSLEAPLKPVVGKWSRKGLQRVLENLCSNAVKYGSKDEKVIVKISHSDTNVTICVLNYGNMISLEDQNSLFEPYRRTKSAHTGQANGWGLGLTLVKGLVEAHKGTVKVESCADKGTIFTMHLPLVSW